MIALLPILLLLAQAPPPSLDQLRTDPNLEHRAKLAIDYAAAAERAAEAAYDKGNMDGLAAELKNMVTGVQLAKEALAQTGKSPLKHPGPYKAAELKTEAILVRLNDLERRMDSSERAVLQVPREKVSEIHDGWFDGIMSKKK